MRIGLLLILTAKEFVSQWLVESFAEHGLREVQKLPLLPSAEAAMFRDSGERQTHLVIPCPLHGEHEYPIAMFMDKNGYWEHPMFPGHPVHGFPTILVDDAVSGIEIDPELMPDGQELLLDPEPMLTPDIGVVIILG